MTTSEFRNLQEDPCTDDDFEIVGEDCKQCTPNPDAFVPDWRYQPVGVPFKNEQTCQYCVVLTIDADGRSINAENIEAALEEFNISLDGSIPLEEYERHIMAKLGNAMTFREEALSIFLEEYGKQDPRGQETEEGIYAATEDGQQAYDLLFSSIACEEALLSTQQTISIGTPFKFLVCVDVESIFWLENKARVEDIQTFYSDDQVVLDGRKLYAQLNRLSYTLNVFGRFSAGSDMTIRTKGEKAAYNVTDYGSGAPKNIFKFYHELREFLRANDYSIGVGRVMKYDLAEEIKIVFDASDPTKPFVIESVYAKKKYCEFEELTKELSKLKTGGFVDQTLMGYISKLPAINNDLTSPTPSPWPDFLLDYTFPQLEIILDGQLVTELEDDPVGMFFEKELNKTVNLVTTAMTKAVSNTFNEWSKKNCSMSRGEGQDPKDDEDIDMWNKIEAEAKAYAFADDSFLSMFSGDHAEVNKDAHWTIRTLQYLGLCGQNVLLDKAIRCLLRGMSFNEFLKAQAKIYMQNLQPQMLQQLAKSLPFSVAEQITSDFVEDFGNAPLPWETSFDNGQDYTSDDAKKFFRLRDELNVQQAHHEYVERKEYLETSTANAPDEIDELTTKQQEAQDYYDEQAIIVREDAYEKEKIARTTQAAEIREQANATFIECIQAIPKNEYDPPPAEAAAYDADFLACQIARDATIAQATAIENEAEALIEDWEPDEDDIREILEEKTKTEHGDTPEGYTTQIEDRQAQQDEEQQELADITEPDQPFTGNVTPEQLEQDLIDLGYLDEDLLKAGQHHTAYEAAQEHAKRDIKRMERRMRWGTGSRPERDFMRQSMDQATLYRPLPNLQHALTMAYVDVALKHVGVADMQRILDNIPDSIPIGPIAGALKCPWDHMYSPPITRFLGSTEMNTVIDCTDGNRLKWPFRPKFTVNMKDAIWTNLKDAFLKSIEDAFTQLMIGLLKQAVDIINEAACKLLGGLGDAAINGLNGGSPDSFGEQLANAFKDKPDFPQNYRDLMNNNMLDKVMDGYGITPDCPEISEEEISQNYRDLYTAIGYALSVRELKELFSHRVENYDPMVLSRVQQSISIHADCFGDTFNTPRAVGTFFRDISSNISLAMKNEIIGSMIEEDSVTPVISSICLSKQQYDDWLRDRIDFLTSLGIPEEIANENVNSENANNAKALETLLNALNNNAKFIEENIANKLGINDGPLFDDKGNLIDPSCYPKNGLLNTNSDDVTEATDKVSSAYFDSLDMTFLKDMSQGFHGGLLDRFLASTADDGYTSHNNKADFIFYRRKRHMGYNDDEVEGGFDKEEQFYPKTVGMLYYESSDPDVTFDSSLSIEAPAPSFLEAAATAATAAAAERIGIREVTDMDPEITYPASFTMEFEQNWDNYDTGRSPFLQVRTSKTELTLNELDEVTNFSINKYTITNYKTYVWNNGLPSPSFTVPLPDSQITVESDLDPVITSYIEENYDLSQSYGYPFRSSIWNKHIKKSFEDINLSIRSDDDDAFYSSSYGKTSELIFNKVKNMCYNTLEGEPNTGFSFGYNPDEELSVENYTYVDPEPGSTEYTKRRSEKILGRAQEPHPRVHFLDPENHGGSYIRPRLYIEPPRASGWIGIHQAMIPELDACEPARTTIINVPEIKKYVNDAKGKIARDPRLNNASDCIKQIPFDLIISQQSRAQIEASIKAIMRVYISEAYIHSAPVFSSIFGGSDENYDNSLFELVSDEMLEDMAGRFNRWKKKLISRKNYVNCFLEQCVQMYARKYYSNEIVPTPEALEALTRLEDSQMRYKYPDVDWLLQFFGQKDVPQHTLPHREPNIDDMPYETYFDIPINIVAQYWPIAVEEGLETSTAEDLNSIPFEDKQKTVQEYITKNFYLNALVYDDIGERMFLPEPDEGPVQLEVEKPPGPLSSFVKRANKFFRFFTRLYTVRVMKKECMIIFRELFKEEFKYIMSSMANGIDEKAQVFRVMQNITTRRSAFFGNNTNFGTFDSVLESTLSGDITSVNNSIAENLFDQMDLSEEEVESIVNNGTFVIQKYFRIIEKDSLEFDPTAPAPSANQIVSTRSLNLYNIVNPESFLDFIQSPASQSPDFEFDDDTLISDVFGTLELIQGLEGQEYVDGVIIDTTTGLEAEPLPEDTPEEDLIALGMKGEMGIKKGLRLLFVPSEEMLTKLTTDNPEIAVLQQQIEQGDYELTNEGLDTPGYTGLTREYIHKKAYFMKPYEDEDEIVYPSMGCAIPITSVEIDEFDKELVKLENFSDDDYRCLLMKLIETDEYKIIFDYCFPVRSYVGFNLIHTAKSFYMSLGQGPDERLKDKDGDKPRLGKKEQPDDDILDSLDDTKDLLRTIFANIYTTEDFEKTFEFDFDANFRGINSFISLIGPQLKRFMGHKQVRRPFDKDGNECESPVGKLFGGK